MRVRSHGLLGGVFALILAMAPVPGSTAFSTQDTRSWQFDGNTYESPQFGYVVEWNDAWAALERDAKSNRNTGDTMILSNNDGRVRVAGRSDAESSAAEFLQETVDLLTQGAETVGVVADHADADVPSMEIIADLDHIFLEAQALDGVVIVVSLLAREDDYEAALGAAQEGVTLNGAPVLSGEAAGPVEETPTEAATEEPTEPPVEEATPIPTEEAPEGATPVPTEATGTDGEPFVSPSFGFTLPVPAGWTVEEETVAEGEETVVLGNGVSTVTVHATNAYDGDLPGCISYAEDLLESDPRYADLRLEGTPEGDPLQGSDDRSAFALFSYTGPDGEKWAHFVHCEYIVEVESVLILSQDSPYEEYRAERQARRLIQNAIELP